MSENQEINKWLQHINNIVWIVTSFFITLHLIVIRSTFHVPISDFISKNSPRLNLLLLIIVFLLLWIVPVSFVFSMIIISEKLHDLLNDSLGIEKLKSALKFDLSKDISIKKFLGAIKRPWGWIIIALTMFFLVTWGWIFFICIKKCN